tara:strand:+ start:680 stop:916 length:237 start_codon:yes stop_codon:yes gene_type:complete
MKDQLFDDSNWKEEYKNFTTNKKYLELLENGAKSISQGWILGSLYNKWKRLKGYDKYDPIENKGQLQSSFKDWESKIK